jgi:hypothetical protein
MGVCGCVWVWVCVGVDVCGRVWMCAGGWWRVDAQLQRVTAAGRVRGQERARLGVGVKEGSITRESSTGRAPGSPRTGVNQGAVGGEDGTGGQVEGGDGGSGAGGSDEGLGVGVERARLGVGAACARLGVGVECTRLGAGSQAPGVCVCSRPDTKEAAIDRPAFPPAACPPPPAPHPHPHTSYPPTSWFRV